MAGSRSRLSPPRPGPVPLARDYATIAQLRGSSQWLWPDSETIRGREVCRAQPGGDWEPHARLPHDFPISASGWPSRPRDRPVVRPRLDHPLNDLTSGGRAVDRGPGRGLAMLSLAHTTLPIRTATSHRVAPEGSSASSTSTPVAPSRPFPAPPFPGHHAPGLAHRSPAGAAGTEKKKKFFFSAPSPRPRSQAITPPALHTAAPLEPGTASIFRRASRRPPRS